MARGQFDIVEKTDLSEFGTPDGLYNLGLMYSTGKDVDIDLVTAHKWFNLAAMRGNQEARKYRSELAAEMTPLQVAEAQRQAREWLATH
jgi:TPR repeat protein